MGERVEDPLQRKRVGGRDGEQPAEDLTLTAAPSPGGAGSGARRGPSSGFTGRTLTHFEMLELVGSGGFGEVYRARDTRLDRIVAIKILPQAFAVDAERRERFRREAIAASALNHPHICTVHDLVEADGHFLIVMELVEGETLHERLKTGPLPVTEALPLAIQIADALGEAHRAGILHRDVKCRNIALSKRGQVKVLDFGLAKLLGTRGGQEGQTLEKLTADGTSPGTPGYMSPEQLLAQPTDRRSDLFSFGVVLYRMLTGRLPFEGTSTIALANAILHAEPREFGDGPIPEKLKAIVLKLLQKDREKRNASAEEVEAELKAVEAELAPGRKTGLSRTAWAAIAAGLLVVVSVGGWYGHRWSQERWVRETTPEITQLVEQEEFLRAAVLLQKARAILPKDPTLEKLWMKATGVAAGDSVPQGANVSIRPYRGQSQAEEMLGQTPLKKLRVPDAPFIWRISKAGFAPITFIDSPPSEWTVRLARQEDVPLGMVTASGGSDLGYPFNEAPWVALDDFSVDRTEVTNEEYRLFVQAGGYENPKFWKEPLEKDGRTLSFTDAMARFLDSTGRPGPATWEAGSFPKGREKHPVAGISWFEAAAYAEFAGRSLPTAYHWYVAAQRNFAALMVHGSNFGTHGTQPVGGPGTLSGFGTVDMAGNVKEWCWNEGRPGTRVILGGGFGEATYMFQNGDEASPWDRRPNFGVRCVKLRAPAPPEATAQLVPTSRDFWKETPVSDEVFEAFKGLYAYDEGPLDAKVEERETTDEWRREKVTFNAAYGGERVIAQLFLPMNSMPPYQVVVFFPGSYSEFMKKLEAPMIRGDFGYNFEFLPKTGRALMIPVYRGQFERPDGLKLGGGKSRKGRWRDRVISQAKDLGRSLDYLAAREDIDSSRTAYLGHSSGGAMAPVLLGVEHRFKAAILVAGGFWFRHPLPEVDALNFVPRVKIPVLMLNGRWDSSFPLQSSQLPLFTRLGTPESDKRHVLYEEGHFPSEKEVIRETLSWLDKYLGPVKR